jgi:hypothetical protein
LLQNHDSFIAEADLVNCKEPVWRQAFQGGRQRAKLECRGCRDFAHLAVTLSRWMNIPARYCMGYLGDIGVPIDPAQMDFSAWYEVSPD